MSKQTFIVGVDTDKETFEDWIAEHNAEVRAEVMIILKSKLPDCDKIDMEHLISLIEEVAKYD